MQEAESTESNINIDKYKKMPLIEALLALDDMPEPDAAKIIDLRKKELGENPELVAKLFNKPFGDIVEALSGDMSKTDAKTIINLKPGFGKKPNVKVITELSKTVESLKEMNSTDAEKIIRKNEKDFGRNPAVLRFLLITAAKLPALQEAVDKTNIVETKHLDVKLTRAVLIKDSDPAVRELRNQAVHKFNATIPRSKDDVYYANPKGHAQDPIDDLVTFMINNSESAFSFLRKPDVQAALSAKPILVARMLLKGDTNLAKTMEKERVFDSLTGEAQETLQHIREIKKAVGTSPLNDTTIGRALKTRLEALIETIVERDGKNVREPKTELSLPDAVAIRNDVQKMQELHQTLQETQTALKSSPLKDNAGTKESLRTLEEKVHQANDNVGELNKILPQVRQLQTVLAEAVNKTNKVEHIGPPTQKRKVKRKPMAKPISPPPQTPDGNPTHEPAAARSIPPELLRATEEEQTRAEKTATSSQSIPKTSGKWAALKQENIPTRSKTITIKASQVAKDTNLQEITAELKKPKPVTPPPSPPTTPRSGRH